MNYGSFFSSWKDCSDNFSRTNAVKFGCQSDEFLFTLTLEWRDYSVSSRTRAMSLYGVDRSVRVAMSMSVFISSINASWGC